MKKVGMYILVAILALITMSFGAITMSSFSNSFAAHASYNHGWQKTSEKTLSKTPYIYTFKSKIIIFTAGKGGLRIWWRKLDRVWAKSFAENEFVTGSYTPNHAYPYLVGLIAPAPADVVSKWKNETFGLQYVHSHKTDQQIKEWSLTFPLWPVPIATLILTCYLVYRILKGLNRAERIRQGHCPHCDYDLTDLEHGQCPECGHPATKR